MTSLSKADYAALIKAVKASQKIIETLPTENIEQCRLRRKEFRGSGGSHWITHARLLDWIEAVNAASATLKALQAQGETE